MSLKKDERGSKNEKSSKALKNTLNIYFLSFGTLRHIGNREDAYNYATIEKLRNDFRADLELELAKRGLE